MKTANWGFDVRELDTKVRPQDDFYTHANGKWMRANAIPKEESRWGSFMILRYETEKRLHSIVEELNQKRGVKEGTPDRMVRDLYRSGMDMARRNQLGITPLNGWLKRIDALATLDDVRALIPDLHVIGVGALFGAAVDQDSKDSTRYILHLYQGGLGLPDCEYYLTDTKESKRVRTKYVPHVTAMFRLMGNSPKDAAKFAKTVMDIETRLAKISMNKEDRRDAEKTYHKKTLRELSSLSPAFDWQDYLRKCKAGTPKAVIVMQPEFFAGISKVLEGVPIEDWKTYLRWHLVSDYAGFLSQSFVLQNWDFYGKTLSGAKAIKPLWRRSLAVVNGALPDLLGQLYVAKHFPPEAKKEMNRLVDDLFTAYRARLKQIDWMNEKTRRYALTKLSAMNRKIGYPSKWKSYKGLEIKENDFCGNALRSSAYEHAREVRKLGRPIDRGEWFMSPQTVNAYFAPNMNDIAFPAAILQPPFFDPNADDAVNYGSIGTVIGHEITHGFDDQGSKYDHRGNLKNWWEKDDRKRFEKKAKLVIDQFNAFPVADGVYVNGKLTLGENIADFGGLAIAYDAYQLRLKRTGRKDLDGMTPEQRFFLGFSLFERENCRPEFEKMAALTDPHSPGKYRINGPVSNFSPFYDAFDVKKGDGLYRAEKIRARIW